MKYTGTKDIYVTVEGSVYTDYDEAVEANHEYSEDIQDTTRSWA